MGDKVERTELLSAHSARAEPLPTEDVVRTGNSIANMFVEGSIIAERFRVVRFVARGGMGEVYEVLDSTLGARVALKTLRPGSPGSDERLARLKREVVLAREVSHPNVCRMFEFFEHRSGQGAPLAFLAMEFLEGETLQSRLKRLGPLDKTEALPLLRKMAEGLEAIHAKGIVHRDFKTSNVMLVPSPDGTRPVVTDFGIAHREGVGETLTGGSVIVGTPAYMAPEVRAGQDATVRSDVYAFGVVACELLAAQLPVDGVPVGLKGRWRRVLARALALDPAERWETPRALVAKLESSPLPSRRSLFLGLLIAALLGLVATGPLRGLIERWTRKPPLLGSMNPENDAVAELYARGQALNRTLRWVEAVPVLEEVVRQQPSLVPAYLELQEAVAATGRWQKSTEIVQEAVRRSARLPEPIRLAAEVRHWESVGGVERARQLARQLHELNPEDGEATLGYLRLLASAPALALAERLRESQASVTNDPRFDQIEAVAATDASQWERALQALARADAKTTGLDLRFLQSKSDFIRAYLALRRLRFGEGTSLLITVEEFYRREGYVLDEAVSMRRRAVGLWGSGEHTSSVQVALRSMELLKPLGPSPELVGTVGFFSQVFALDGRLALARKALEYTAGFPDVLLRRSPEFFFASAVVARESADLRRAESMVDAAVASYPLSPVGWLGLKAQVLLDEDRLDELDQHVEEWVRRGRDGLGPEEREFVALIQSMTALARHQPSRAASLISAIPSENNWQVGVLVVRSEIALQQGKARSATHLANEALREATLNAGDSTGIWPARLLLARSYEAAGESTRATSLLDALEADALREGAVPLRLQVRLARWDDPPFGPARHPRELKQLESDAAAQGFLLISRQAREAATR